MKKNMGKADRGIRLMAAAIMFTLYFSGTVTGTWGIAGMVIAGVFVATGLIGFCPLYTLLGIRTCKISS